MQTQLLIGGEWRDGAGAERFDVENPANEEVIASVAAGTTADATEACEAAAAAQASWAATAPRERGEILRRTWQLMVEHTDELVWLLLQVVMVARRRIGIAARVVHRRRRHVRDRAHRLGLRAHRHQHPADVRMTDDRHRFPAFLADVLALDPLLRVLRG